VENRKELDFRAIGFNQNLGGRLHPPQGTTGSCTILCGGRDIEVEKSVRLPAGLSHGTTVAR
jgi:hypothetical protein